MRVQDARDILASVLEPFPVDRFLDETLVEGKVALSLDGRPERIAALGGDPEAAILDAHASLATKLTFHSAAPLGSPPGLEAAPDAAGFRRKVEAFHGLGYSVRFPELRRVLPGADLFARALEVFLHQPVTVSAFWSRGELVAPVHFDDHDLIIVQIRGEKQWSISTQPSSLPNVWKTIPAGPPQLGEHQRIDVRPGDLIYLPRGAYHTVTSSGDSLHLAIGFTPVTLRDAVIAALDSLSDLDPFFRQALGVRLAPYVQAPQAEALAPQVREGVARLWKASGSSPFLHHALQRRASRVVAGLEPLRPFTGATVITDETRVRRTQGATCHISANAEKIDFSHPGGHIYIHRGVEAGVRFIAEASAFQVGDIPGPGGPDVRASLVEKFFSIGFLEPAI